MKKFTIMLLAIAIVVMSVFGLTACDNGNINSKMDAMQSTIEQLQKELAKSGSDVNAMQSIINQLQQELANNDSDVDAMQSIIEQLQEALEKSGDDANALKDQITQLTSQINNLQGGKKLAYDSYTKVQYIDKNLHDRDCIKGENFQDTQEWIKETALAAGYAESAIQMQEFTFTRRGTTYTSQNIVITKEGISDKQIIVGAHYDGDGTGDNGSGIALAITTAEKFVNIETPYTIKFVFFTAEEYGCYGSTAYANAMTDEEVANTLYMINLDSLVCGDFCYIYGGVQDKDKKIVTQTEAYDNAMSIANSLGLDIHSNPWTWDNVEPDPSNDTGMPKYASPSTGDWSDHKGFKNRGIKYLYMEATNWEIPGPYNEYDGYGETVLVGMLMNTKNDYLEYIEKYFPGRIQEHLSQFATLLNALLQSEVNF
ncbi:MAG: M28 family peptidase [Clostridiales bacterium]|nr:M28 family peptidase [Clostridiales bacterium]